MRIGYVGLGAMGGALARHLLGKHQLTVFDLNPAATRPFGEAGARIATTCADLARDCEIVLLCLPRSSDVRQALFGEAGLAAGLAPGAIVVDQTSGVPQDTRAFAQQLAQRGVQMMDAPVSGAMATAIAGTISVIASGPRAVFDTVAPVLRDISSNVFHCGERVGNGQTMKAVNNLMNVSCRFSTLELVALGRKLGLPLAALTEALNATSARSYTSQVMLPAIAAGRQSTKFHLALQVKDMNQAILLGQAEGVPMPIAGVARGLLQVGLSTLGPNAQLEEMIGVIERLAGSQFVEPPSPKLPQSPQSSIRTNVAYCGQGALDSIVLARMRRTHDVQLLASADALRATEADVIVIGDGAPAGIDAVLEACDRKATVIVDQRLRDPEGTRALAATLERRGVALVDAPIHCELTTAFPDASAIFCGGTAAALDRVQPLLEAMGARVIRFGGVGSGHTARALVGAIAACVRMATYECAAVGFKNGLGIADMARVLDRSSGQNSATTRVLPHLGSGVATTDRPFSRVVDELQLASLLAMREGTPSLLGNLVGQTCQAVSNVLDDGATFDDARKLVESAASLRFVAG